MKRLASLALILAVAASAALSPETGTGFRDEEEVAFYQTDFLRLKQRKQWAIALSDAWTGLRAPRGS